MAIVVLNRRRIVSSLPLWLREADQALLLVTSRDVVEPGELVAVADQFEAIAIVDDYDGSGVDDVVEGWVGRHAISRIVSASEVDVIRAARLRRKLGLPGQDMASALAYRDKMLMKSILADRGVAVPAMARLDGPEALVRFARRVGFPVVVKPRLGGGSVGVRKLSGDQDLADMARALPAAIAERGPMMAEQWVDGRFLTVDGLMANGRVLQIWPSFTTANLEAVSSRSLLYSHMLTRGDPTRRRVADFVASAIAELPPIEEVTAFHAEVFLRPDGSFRLCEIACRPGGCGHVPVYELAFGINLYAETLRGQAGLPRLLPSLEDIHSSNAGFVWFPPRAGRLAWLPESCPVPEVMRFRPTGVVGATYSVPKSISDHIAQAFVMTDVDGDLGPALAAVGEWWSETVRWN